MQLALHGGRQPWRRGSALTPYRRFGIGQVPGGVVPGLFQPGRLLLIRIEFRQAQAGGLAVVQDVRQRLAVFATHLAQELAPVTHRGQADRVVLQALGQGSQVRRNVTEFDGDRTKALMHASHRRMPGQHGDHVAQGVGRTTVAAQRGLARGRGVAVGAGIGQAFLLQRQVVVLVG